MPRRPRTAEDDAAFQGLGKAVTLIREKRGLERDELAEKIEEDRPVLEKIERGEVNADWATLRALTYALDLPLGALLELAEELAPGRGGEEWRQQTSELRKRRPDEG